MFPLFPVRGVRRPHDDSHHAPRTQAPIRGARGNQSLPPPNARSAARIPKPVEPQRRRERRGPQRKNRGRERGCAPLLSFSSSSLRPSALSAPLRSSCFPLRFAELWQGAGGKEGAAGGRGRLTHVDLGGVAAPC